MKVHRIVANIQTADIAKADVFYRGVLGLKLVMDHGWIRTYGSSEKAGPGELLRNEVTRAAAEAGAGVGGGADVPEARDLSSVPGGRWQWAPEEVLVEFCGAAVRVAGHRIGVVGDEVARGDDVDGEQFRGQVGGVPRDPGQHPARVAVSQVLVPAAGRIELARGITEWGQRQLLEPQPE